MIKENEYFNPSNDPLDAFRSTQAKYPYFGNRVDDIAKNPRSMISEVMGNYVSDGYNYLELYGETETVKNISHIASVWISDKQISNVAVPYIDRVLSTNSESNRAYMDRVKKRPNSPQFFFGSEKKSNSLKREEVGDFVAPLGFAILAQNQPLEALGSLVNAGAMLRDFVNGIHLVESIEEMSLRADTIEAEFIFELRKKHYLILSQGYREILSRLNRARINTPVIQYKGATGSEYLNAKNN